MSEPIKPFIRDCGMAAELLRDFKNGHPRASGAGGEAKMAHPDFWRTSGPQSTDQTRTDPAVCDGDVFQYAESINESGQHRIHIQEAGDSGSYSATVTGLYDPSRVDPFERLNFWKAFE